MYSSFNIGDEPLKILKLSNTRWLSIAPCVQRLLQQYEELKLHFQVARDEERNYTADLLYQIYYDAENELYLMFLEPILIELNRVNRLFQLDSCSPIKLTDEIVTMYRSILLHVVRPTTFTTWLSTMEYDIDNPENHLPLGAIYFGTNFTLFVEEATIDREIVNQVKERCRNYLMELLREMRKRLPTNMEQLQSISSLSPSIVLGQAKPKLQDLSFLSLYDGNIAILEEQWNRISVMQWPHTDDKDTEGFWINIAHYKDASGENDFEELGMFILSLLALPFSNASVERTFSQMNILKSKLRNKMQQPMLEALLHIRSFMERSNICCNEFVPTKTMLNKFNNDIYAST